MTMLVHAPAVLFASDSDTEQERVDRLIEQGGGALAALALLLQRGEITKAQFLDRGTAELRAHAQTAARLAAGSATDADAIDGLIDSKADYLDGFADDLDSGSLSDKQIAARAALWGGLMHTAYQMAKGHEAADQAGDGQTVSITWRCLNDASSCDDCPALADGGPYSFDTLPTHPGEDVQCGGRCRCELDYEIVPASEADDATPADDADFAVTVIRSAAVVFAGGRA